MQNVLKFDAAYGEETKAVRIVLPQHGGGYQIYIANYFQGEIIQLSDGYRTCLNVTSHLTSDDILILIDMLKTAKIASAVGPITPLPSRLQ